MSLVCRQFALCALLAPALVAAQSKPTVGPSRGTVIVVGLTAGTQVTLDFYELYARRVISYAAPVVPHAERQRAFDAMAAHVAAGRLPIASC